MPNTAEGVEIHTKTAVQVFRGIFGSALGSDDRILRSEALLKISSELLWLQIQIPTREAQRSLNNSLTNIVS